MPAQIHNQLFLYDNVRLGLSRAGDTQASRVLIMLHGLASNATRWHEYMQYSELNALFELIAIDLRGHGRSLTYQRFTRQDWIDDVHRLLGSRTQTTALLAGHSLGAQIALDYASQCGKANTAKLSALVLIDPIFPQALSGILKRVAQFRWLLPPLCGSLRAAYKLGLHKRHYPYRDLQALDLQTRAFLQAHPHKSIADLYMNPFADLAYMPLANYLQDLYEVTRPLNSLAAINIPVLVLLSSGASTSVAEQNRMLLGEIPRLEIKTIDADHWLLTERPAEARAVIDAWCRRIAGL